MVDWSRLEKVETEEDRALKAEVEDAKSYLRDTDWYAVRFMETQAPVPADVSEKRAAARLKISEWQN